MLHIILGVHLLLASVLSQNPEDFQPQLSRFVKEDTLEKQLPQVSDSVLKNDQNVNATCMSEGKVLCDCTNYSVDIRDSNGETCSCCRVFQETTPNPADAEIFDGFLQPPEKTGCGWRNPQGVADTLTYTPGVTQFGEFPWMVAILVIEKEVRIPNHEPFRVYVGGGSLIHMRVVMTTAHHVNKPRVLKIRAGEWNSLTTKEMYPHQERNVKSVEIHDDFNEGFLYYDVALLFLDRPIDPAPHIGIACLPPPKFVQPEGTRCLASGWGKTSYERRSRYQTMLKKVEVPIVKRKTCQAQLRKTRLGRPFQLHRSFMCAGAERGRDTCTGDGGSPLVCPLKQTLLQPDRYLQVGMVAWGMDCGEEGVPGVYVDVSTVREWVDKTMADYGLDEMEYARYYW